MAKNKRDYYEILGVSKNANSSEIKKAFRKLAREHHPDAHGDSQNDQAFKEINEAYEVLSNDDKRAMYDRVGHVDDRQSFYESQNPFGEGFGGFDVESIFSQFFGGNPRGNNRQQSYRGQDINSKLEISFIQSVLGYEFKEEIEKYSPCSTCNGTGAKTPKDLKECQKCNGKGKVVKSMRTPFGVTQVQDTCSTCRGKGKTIEKKCAICHGRTYVKEKPKVKITIPQGISSGQLLHLKGFGGPGSNGQPSGDMVLRVYVRDHKFYKRDGADILLKMPISIIDIIRESKIKIPTPYGTTEIRLNKRYKNGTIISIKGKGFKTPKGFGNLKIIIDFYIPEMSLKETNYIIDAMIGNKDKAKEDFLKKVENAN